MSKWLFIGQFCASAGFLTYSLLLHDWVYMVTNGLMALAAVLGLGIYLNHHRRERHGGRRGVQLSMR